MYLSDKRSKAAARRDEEPADASTSSWNFWRRNEPKSNNSRELWKRPNKTSSEEAVPSPRKRKVIQRGCTPSNKKPAALACVSGDEISQKGKSKDPETLPNSAQKKRFEPLAIDMNDFPQLHTIQNKLVPSGSTSSVASTPTVWGWLCRLDDCNQVSDGLRCNFLCRTHYLLQKELHSDVNYTRLDWENEDKKPPALACAVECGDDISQLGESQDTLFCSPASPQDNLEVTQKFDASQWKNNSFLNYSEDRCCQCDEEATEEDPLYECTCKKELRCRRLWHMGFQNEVLLEAKNAPFKSIDRKTFHCLECINFEKWNLQEQLDFLRSCEEDSSSSTKKDDRDDEDYIAGSSKEADDAV